MTAGYKKPHVTMNRPKYGNKVRPVKERKKKLELVKPSVMDLKRIYSRLAKSATWQKPDVLCEAIQWYRVALRYVQQVTTEKGIGYTATVARELTQWQKYTKEVATSTSVTVTDAAILKALKAAKYVCDANGFKTPSVQTYLVKGKKVAKKLDVREKSLNTRYDKVLTLFSQAYGDGLTFKVSPMASAKCRINNSLNTLYYSPTWLKELTAKLHHEGLLPVVIQEAWDVARARSYSEKEVMNGRFLVGGPSFIADVYKRILEDFVQWAVASPYAPKTLVRRKTKPKKKKSKEAVVLLTED